MWLTPARPEQTGVVPDARHREQALLPVGRGLRGPRVQRGHTASPPGDKDGRQAVGQAELLLPGAHKRRSHPSRANPLRQDTSLQPGASTFCAHSASTEGCSHTHTPQEIYQDPQPPGLGQGFKSDEHKLSVEGGSGTHAARQAPSQTAPTQSVGLSSQVTQRGTLGGTQTGLRTQRLVPLPHGSG